MRGEVDSAVKQMVISLPLKTTKFLGKCFRSCLSFINPRISPLTMKYECPRLSLLIITLIPKANIMGPESYDVIPC